MMQKQGYLSVVLMLVTLGAFADADEVTSRTEDRPAAALSSAEIVALPRPKTTKTPVHPEAGVYIGSGVYQNKGLMKQTRVRAY